MPLPMGDLSTLFSLVGSLTLGVGKGLFDESKTEEASVRLCLEDLGARQIEQLVGFLDNEVVRADARLHLVTVDDLRETDSLRRDGAENLLDRLWEDALTGRRLEDVYHEWCRHERAGRSACVVGFFANIGLLLIGLFGLQVLAIGPAQFAGVAVLVLVIPWGMAILARIRTEPCRRHVMRILESSRYGVPHARKFGDE